MSEISPALRHELDLSWVGAHFASILYGVFIVLSMANIHSLWRRKDRIFLSYTVILFISTTIYYAVAIDIEQLELIDDPQSTLAFPLNKDLVVHSFWLIDQTLVDGLLVYRCYIIWNDYRQIVILPFILFFSAFASYVALLVASGNPGSSWASKSIADLNTLSWSLSTAVEVVAAFLIAGRMIHQRFALKSHVDARQLRGYSSAPSIILESAAIYAAAGVATITVVSLHSQLAAIFVPIFGLIQSITPNLILYRVIKSRTIHAPAIRTKQHTDMAFASPPTLLSTSTISDTTRTCNVSTDSGVVV